MMLFSSWVWASNPVHNVQVTLRGEVYYVSNVSTIQELQDRLQAESGWDPTEQGSVTFQGRVLEPMDSLFDVGINSGDQVNIVPKRIADHWKMMNDMGNGLLSLHQELSSRGLQNSSPEQWRDLQVMTNLYRDLTKVPYMQEEIDRFSQYLKNPQVVDTVTDPDRVETLRQIILNNPLLLKTLSESSVPTKVALQDPDLWYQHVQSSVAQWKTLDGYQLWQRIVEGRLFCN